VLLAAKNIVPEPSVELGKLENGFNISFDVSASAERSALRRWRRRHSGNLAGLGNQGLNLIDRVGGNGGGGLQLRNVFLVLRVRAGLRLEMSTWSIMAGLSSGLRQA